MKKLFLIAFIGVFLSILYLSCKKEDTCGFVRSTFENKRYKITNTIDSNGVDITYSFRKDNPCYDSLYITLRADASFSFDYGKCPSTDFLAPGSWLLSMGNNKNYFYENTRKFEVINYSCNSLTLQDISSISVTTYTITVTLKQVN
ncbi:MAG: hypothetical protein QM539_02025 [Alphaproteobacteria bacterium]|nr:hypothetical protein [Alphaproteobacteria bacterium]